MQHLDVDHQTLGLAAYRVVDPTMERAHSHADLELNVLVTGQLRYLVGGHVLTLSGTGAGLFWAGVPHRILDADEGTEFLWLTVPLAWFLQWNVEAGFTEKLLRGEMLRDPDTDDAAAAADQLSLTRWITDLASPRAPGHGAALLEVEARIRRFATAVTARDHDPGGSVEYASFGGRRLEAVTLYVGKHYREPITITDIAVAVGFHPDYLTQWFRRQTGLPLWEYVTRVRVSAAQRLLLTTDLPVLQIGLEAGFGSPSRFYESFRRVCGQTPRKYRLEPGAEEPALA